MRIICSGDQHIRSDVPLCRLETDEQWKQFQRDRLNELVDIANTNSADILFTGDTFDVPRVTSEMVSMLILALQNLGGTAHFISGNHEKAYRREANVGEASIGIIKALAGDNTGRIRYYVSDEHVEGTRFEHSYRLNDEITMVHTLSFPSEDDVPFGCEASTPDDLFAKYDTPYICVGDCHLAFHVELEGRHIVSSGCLDAQTVKEMEYEPSVYFVDTSTGTVERIKLFHDPAMITDEHIKERHERDDRIASAVSVIRMGKKLSLSFKDNLKEAESESKLSVGAKGIITEIDEEVRGDIL